MLKEAWDRYGLPMAITESHLGCSREEQMRWLVESWKAAEGLRGEGADVRAVTVWSLLGAFDWNSLLTRKEDKYESGVFDVSMGELRETGLTHVVRALGKGTVPNHPVLQEPGWWNRPVRLVYPPVAGTGASSNDAPLPERTNVETPPLVIVGASGTLGKAFARLCELRGISFELLSREQMDITQPTQICEVLQVLKPWAVVNAANYASLDDAEADADRCMEVNGYGPASLAETCGEIGSKLLTFSSGMVFDGSKEQPYVEADRPQPLNLYGKSKALAEALVSDVSESALIVRSSAFFGAWEEVDFLHLALKSLAEGRQFRAAADAWISPTFVPDLVNESLDLLLDDERGIWHLSNSGAVTWAGFAKLAAGLVGLDPELVVEVDTDTFGYAAPRPRYSVLGSSRGKGMPTLESALTRYLQTVEAPWTSALQPGARRGACLL